MKAAVALSLLAVALCGISVLAQDPAAKATAEAACGPTNIKFDVKEGAADPSPQLRPGKALVYVVEDLGGCPDCPGQSKGFNFTNTNNALVRVGMDGAWIGANQGSSYFFFSVDPGEHHLCINWQSRLAVRSRAFAMAGFTAEAGRVYYFRERVFPGSADYSFDLDPINSDEGKYLVASSSYSVSRAKK
jgi:hypothetical protein